MAKIYSNVDIKKFGDLQQQNAAGHNLRQIPSPNVNTQKSHLNKFFVGSASMNFLHELTTKLARFKVRKNAVKTVNLVFSASPELFKDKSKTALWEKATFDFIVKEFGLDNIVYAVVHHDEKTPHFQVSVVPVDPKGKLNASHFFDGRKKCDDFATRYNQAVKHLGLLRDKGIEKAKPQDTRDFYQKVAESKEFDSKVDEAIKEAEKQLASSLPIVKKSTVKKLLQPFYNAVKRYKARAIADKKKLQDAEKISKENEQLKLKFDEVGLSHKMTYLELQEVKSLITEGRSARAEKKARAFKGEKKGVENSTPFQNVQQKNIKPR